MGRPEEPSKPLDPGDVAERLDAFDPLLEHRVRLAILVLLARWDRIAFTRLRELTAQTDGNLGAHLRKLEEAGYITVKKEFVERRPVSWYAISRAGRNALTAHVTALDGLIRDTPR